MSTKGREYNEEHEQAAFKEEQEHAETKPFGKNRSLQLQGYCAIFLLLRGYCKKISAARRKIHG